MQIFETLKSICKRVNPECEVLLTSQTMNDYYTSHYTAPWVCVLISDYTENVAMDTKSATANTTFNGTILFIAKDRHDTKDYADDNVEQSTIDICEAMKVIANKVLKQLQYEYKCLGEPKPKWKQSLILRKTSNFFSGVRNDISFVYLPKIDCIQNLNQWNV